MAKRIAQLLAALALLLTGVAAAGPAPAPLRVLFIGNSLTSFHDMPLMVEAIAVAAGGPRIVTREVVRGGYSLGDHLAEAKAPLFIHYGRWDFVVMQQGPSSLPANRDILRRDIARFTDLIRARGGEPAVYQVWPAEANLLGFPDVIESYRLAAEDVGAPLLAVGSAWQAAWSLDPALPLYGPDRLHPSPLASYMAALVIYEGLTRRSAVGVPGTLRLRNGRRFTFPDAQVALVQQAAEMVRQP